MGSNDAWPNLTLQNYRRAFETHRALVAKPAPQQPDEVGMALARFLTVRACGYIEAVVEECVSSYTLSRSAPQVARYSKSWLGKGRNPSPGNLLDLTSRFDQSWADEFSALLSADDDLVKRELALLVDRRNKIAHGAGENITARKALDFAELAIRVGDWLINRFDTRK